jgi:hypothetical protein
MPALRAKYAERILVWLLPDSCQESATLGRVQSGVAAGHRAATRSALDGFRTTPDTRGAGMSHLNNRLGASNWRARARGAPKARARRGQRRAAERSGAALIINKD